MLINFFFYIFISGLFYRGEGSYFINVCRGSLNEHFCESSLKSNHWPMRGCHLKVLLVLSLAAILISIAELF